MTNYLIEGVSGTGKTTVCEELKNRGYKAVEADEEIAHYADPKTGLPTEEKIQIIGYGMKKNSRKLYNEMEMTQFLYVEEQ